MCIAHILLTTCAHVRSSCYEVIFVPNLNPFKLMNTIAVNVSGSRRTPAVFHCGRRRMLCAKWIAMTVVTGDLVALCFTGKLDRQNAALLQSLRAHLIDPLLSEHEIHVFVYSTSTVLVPSAARSATTHSPRFLEHAAVWTYHRLRDNFWRNK